MRRKRVGRREEEQGAAELFDLALPCYLFEFTCNSQNCNTNMYW